MWVTMDVNGESVAADIEPRLSLADFLRDSLGLTGTRLGCEHGVCGACTVVIDGLAVRSCLVFAVQASGARIRTVESLATGELHPLQQAFQDAGALQCGFCTSGFLMTALPLYEQACRLGREEIRAEIAGNLCRCTGYSGIVDAISQALEGGRESA